MDLRCASCGAENPATNRYCGQCGKALQPVTTNLAATGAPREFQQDSGNSSPAAPPEPSVPPHATGFENRIPFFTDQGTDRRLHTPPDLFEPYPAPRERDPGLLDQLQQEGETHTEVRAIQDAEHDSHSKFLRWDAEPSTPRTGVSGPSFLGLTDDRPAEYEDACEEAPHEPHSHLRRNIAIAAVALALLLIDLQWRSIRNYGLAYVRNGSMPEPVMQPKISPEIAADNSSRAHGLPATSAAGKPADTAAESGPSAPQAIESSPNADHSLPVSQAGNTPAPNAVALRASHPPSATTQPAQPSSMSAPPTDVSGNESPAASVANYRPLYPSTPAPAPPAADAASAASTPPSAIAEPSVALNPPAFSDRKTTPTPSRAPNSAPGADEMRRAANATDPQLRATWLWRAVGKGNPQAPVELARMYEQGSGVTQSCDQAQLLLRAAASRGNQQARLSLQQIRIRGGCR